MEEFRRLVQNANRAFKTADHLAYVTYRLVNDVKLTITITENLLYAMTQAMDAVIYYDRLYKRIGPVPENFNSRFEIFKNKCAPRYGIGNGHISLMRELRSLIQSHAASPMEFVRNDKFVICSNGYRNVKSIDITKLKSYITQIRDFMSKVNTIGRPA